LQLAQGLAVVLKVHIVIGMIVDVPLFEKTVELEARQPKQLIGFKVTQRLRLGKVVGKLDGDLHGSEG